MQWGAVLEMPGSDWSTQGGKMCRISYKAPRLHCDSAPCGAPLVTLIAEVNYF